MSVHICLLLSSNPIKCQVTKGIQATSWMWGSTDVETCCWRVVPVGRFQPQPNSSRAEYEKWHRWASLSTSSQFLQQREFDSEKERRAKNCNIFFIFIGRSLVHVRFYTSAKRSDRRWRSPLGILAASWAKAARTSRHSAAWFITTRASQTGTRVILQQGSQGHFSTKKIKNKKCQST